MIEDTLKKLEKDYDIRMVSDVPMINGQHLYVVNMVTKPLYSREQLRLWDIPTMSKMEIKNEYRP